MKKILILCDYFYPDVASTGQLLTELCLNLQNDFTITVITSVPSLQADKYKNDINYEKYQNIHLYRIKTKPFDKRNKLSRIKHIVMYYFLCKKAIRKIEKQDIVYTISQPPILGGLLGRYAKDIHKSKFVYNIQDFNPEQIEAVGYSKSSLLINILRKVDIKTCNAADRIILVGNDMKQTLRERNILEDSKILVINNWIDENIVYPICNEKVLGFKNKYNLNDKIVFMYSGNIGLYYDLENIIKVIARFKNNNKIVFAFVGDGAKKVEIESYTKQNNLVNVRFIPFQNKNDIIYSLNSADVHLVTNKKGIKGVSVPSKIYGVMAVGKYVLGIVENESEAANLISRSNSGLVVEPGDYEGIYNAINYIINLETEKRIGQGLNGRKYLEEHLTKNKSISKYKQLLSDL